MMRKLIFYTTFLLILSSCQKAATKISDWDDMHLHGKVKTIEENFKGGNSITYFNKEGFIDSSVYSGGQNVWKYVYNRDENGWEEERLVYLDDSLFQNYTYEYAENHRECTVTFIQEGTTDVQDLDESGRVVYSAFSEVQSDYKRELYVTYNDKGFKVEDEVISTDKESQYKSGQKLTYDKEGNLVKSIYSTDFEGSTTESITKFFAYKFDQQGNWVEHSFQIEGSPLITTKTRSYTYYK